jgi:hypothetical protein
MLATAMPGKLDEEVRPGSIGTADAKELLPAYAGNDLKIT